LTIRNVTKPAEFEGTVTLTTPTSISGNASTKVKRADYGLIVPSLRFLADVGEDVKVEISFKADAAN